MTFGAWIMVLLKAKAVWSASEAVSQSTVEKRVFHVQRDRELYRLILVDEERELTTIRVNDADFARRILVDLGDLAKEPTRDWSDMKTKATRFIPHRGQKRGWSKR